MISTTTAIGKNTGPVNWGIRLKNGHTPARPFQARTEIWKSDSASGTGGGIIYSIAASKRSA